MSCRITQFEPETKLQPGFCLYVGSAPGGLEVFSIYSHFGSKVTFTKFIYQIKTFTKFKTIFCIDRLIFYTSAI